MLLWQYTETNTHMYRTIVISHMCVLHSGYLRSFEHWSHFKTQSFKTYTYLELTNNTQKLSTTFQSNYFRFGIHDRRICWDWTSDRIICIVHINNNHLSSLTNLLPNTDEFVGLHCESRKSNVRCIDTNVLKLNAYEKIRNKLPI